LSEKILDMIKIEVGAVEAVTGLVQIVDLFQMLNEYVLFASSKITCQRVLLRNKKQTLFAKNFLQRKHNYEESD